VPCQWFSICTDSGKKKFDVTELLLAAYYVDDEIRVLDEVPFSRVVAELGGSERHWRRIAESLEAKGTILRRRTDRGTFAVEVLLPTPHLPSRITSLGRL
jgi:hypothetical protein